MFEKLLLLKEKESNLEGNLESRKGFFFFIDGGR